MNLSCLYFIQLLQTTAFIIVLAASQDILQVIEDTCGSDSSHNLLCDGSSGDDCISRHHSNCQCDVECAEYGECCVDQFNSSCKVGAERSAQVEGIKLGGKNGKHKCVESPTGYNHKYKFTQFGHWLVSKCDNHWPIRDNVRRACEVSGWGDVDGHLLNYRKYEGNHGTNKSSDIKEEFRKNLMDRHPVIDTDTGSHYRNEACAKCNDVSVARRRRWDVHVECDEKEEDVREGGDLIGSLARLVNSGCYLQMSPPEDLMLPRSCPRERVMTTCLEQWMGSHVYSTCLTYTGYIFSEDGTLYRNPHCLLCNTNREDNRITKVPQNRRQVRKFEAYEIETQGCKLFNSAVLGAVPPKTSFFLLFNTQIATNTHKTTSSNDDAPKACPPGTSYNPPLSACTLSRLTRSTSFTLLTTYTRLECANLTSKSSCHIRLQVTSTNSTTTQVSQLTQWMESRIVQSASENDIEIASQDIAVTISFAGETYSSSLQPVKYGINRTSPHPVLYTLQFIPLYILHTQITYSLSPLADTSSATAVIGQIIDELTSHVGLEVSGGILRVVGLEGEVELDSKLSCEELVLVDEVKWMLAEDAVKLYLGEGSMDLIVNTSHYMISDNNLFICESIFSKYFPLTSAPHITNMLWIGTLTFILTILSIFSLILGIILHILFKPLRTLPGFNLSSLMFTLLLAHTFHLAQPHILHLLPPSACTLLAATLHFLYLWAFTWMNICSFTIYHTFTNLFTSRSSYSIRSTYLYNLVYSTLYPSLPVLITLSLHYTTALHPLPYSSSYLNLCWFGNATIFLLLFGLPLLLILLSNLYFFLRTLQVLRTRPTIPSSLPSSPSNNLMIVVRITVLLGFTWILPFLALIPSLSSSLVLRLLTDITNALQGTALFLSYALRKQVINMVKNGVGRMCGDNNSRDKTVSTSLTPQPQSNQLPSLAGIPKGED